MKNAFVLCILLWIFSLEVQAEHPHFIPPNSLKNPIIITKQVQSTLTEADFNQVTKTLYNIYSPIIEAKAGVSLIMKADWQSSVVNAYATREVESWTVHVSGGIARAKGMTKDALALIVCHEIGHHLAGAPKTFRFDGWPAAEGQADYWASSKCLKKYFAQLLGEEISIEQNIPEKVLADCTNTYGSSDRMKICVKSMLATVHFSNFLNSLPTNRTPTSILGKDNRVVKGTNTNDYPRPQCRIDTLYQGSLCTIEADVETSENDPTIGHCNDGTIGTRPPCWYRP